MKNFYLYAMLFALCGSSAFALTIDLGAVSNATRTNATFYGNLSATNGTTNTVSVILYRGTFDGATNGSSWSSSNTWSGITNTGILTTNIYSLTPATTYYWRWYSCQSTNTDWSPASSNFSTLAGVPTSGSSNALYQPVMVNTNGVFVSPTNLAAANGLGTTGDIAGLQSQITSNDIDIGAIQTNVAAQVIRIGAVEDYTNSAAQGAIAYGWGNHALGGYAGLNQINTFLQPVFFTQPVTFSNSYIYLDNDMDIHSTNTNSRISIIAGSSDTPADMEGNPYLRLLGKTYGDASSRGSIRIKAGNDATSGKIKIGTFADADAWVMGQDGNVNGGGNTWSNMTLYLCSGNFGGTSAVAIAVGPVVSNEFHNGSAITNSPIAIPLSYQVITADMTNEIAWAFGGRAATITNISWGSTIGDPVCNLIVSSNNVQLCSWDYIRYTGLVFVANTAMSNLAVNMPLPLGTRVGFISTNGTATNAYVVLYGTE